MAGRRARRWALIGGGVLTVGIVVAGGYLVWGGTGPATPAAGAPGATETPVSAGTAARVFLTGFTSNQLATAAKHTDNPEAAAKAMDQARKDLTAASIKGTLTAEPAPKPEDTEATAKVNLAWDLGQGRLWVYDGELRLTRAGTVWRVVWSPALIHPQLGEGQRLALRAQSGQAPLLDRDGKPLLSWEGGRLVEPDKTLAPQLLPALRKSVEHQLGGKDGWRVLVIGADGAEVKALHEQRVAVTKPPNATLSAAVQRAAQNAVGSAPNEAMLVAVHAPTGELMAVGQNAAADAQGVPALSRRYPPGSTFKVVTAAAALQAGKTGIDQPVACPGVATIGQRTVRNNNFDLGTVPLRTAFARSCNTTFAQFGADLPANALTSAARQLGIGVDFTLPGLTMVTGSVPAAADTTQRVEDSYGQGRVEASPFGMAMAAATVANGGRLPVPSVLRGSPAEVDAKPAALPREVADQLRSMMREVVTAGTAKSLNGIRGVHGKTGTAQFGSGERAHGWFIGFRGEVAFAVLVTDAGSSEPAVAAAGAFLKGFG